MLKRILGTGAAMAMACSAFGGTMVFTDRGAWEAAVGGPIVTEDFNSLGTQSIADGQTLDTGLIQIKRDGSPNGADGALLIEPGSAFGNFDGTNFLDGETGAAPHERVDLSFGGANIVAFGADWVSPFSGDGIGIEVGSDLILLDSITGFNAGFVGFISDTDSFETISIVGNPANVTFQELWSADNFSFVVPEPGTLSLLFVGAAALGARRRR
ncbi:MAG: PEP-CTERM sorting domain-containing protein [Phycisphaerae bacterium]